MSCAMPGKIQSQWCAARMYFETSSHLLRERKIFRSCQTAINLGVGRMRCPISYSFCKGDAQLLTDFVVVDAHSRFHNSPWCLS